MNEPFVDNPVGRFAEGRVYARVQFSDLDFSTSHLLAESGLLYETESGNRIILD